jgi:error-prone DNA polymerase
LKIGNAITASRQTDGPYASEYDLKRRVPSIRKTELTLLAKAGAFNWTGKKHDRRTALWRAECAGQSVEPLFENIPDEFEIDDTSPLLSTTIDERLVADFFISGFTISPHPMAYHRAEINEADVLRAADLKTVPNGTFVQIAGAVIARQRPGTASGFIFLSNEDETGISNAIIHPKLYAETACL